MDYNYHTHTYRCGHASGTEEEYIQRAIEGGIRDMGFSDHMPWRFPDGYEAGFRVPTALAEDYVKCITALGEKYREKITLHVGFEMEYYPTLFAQMKQKAVEYGAEYLILGEHFTEPEHPEPPFYAAHEIKDPKTLYAYVDRVCEAMRTGVFSYVAHPDILRFVGDEALYLEQMRKICQTSLETDVPLEINCLGIRDGRFYPHEAFWQMAGEVQCPVVIGFDAHDARSAFDGDSLMKAEAMIRFYNLHALSRPRLRPLK